MSKIAYLHGVNTKFVKESGEGVERGLNTKLNLCLSRIEQEQIFIIVRWTYKALEY